MMIQNKPAAARAGEPLPLIVAMAFLLCSCRQLGVQRGTAAETLSDRQVAVLNGLRNEVNLNYGYLEGWPRVNRGPCGRFAKAFREQWNTRFKHKINIAFIMKPDGGCDHVLVKLPDGSYFDGGSGVIPGATLLREFRLGDRIEEMVEFAWSFLTSGPTDLGVPTSYAPITRTKPQQE